MRTIYGQRSNATTDTSSVGAARARRLCAGLVLAGALFGSAAPAHADDTLAVGGLSGSAIDATVAAVQGAALAQASAIVNDAVTEATSSAVPGAAPPTTTPQPGSGSGVAGGTSSGATATPAGVDQPADAASSTADPAPAAVEQPVVAPTEQVVSPPTDSETPSTTSPDASAVPSAALDRLAREYQQNPARYHSLNSLPISRATVPVSGMQSIIKREPFTSDSPASNPSANDSQNCRRDVLEADAQTSCDRPDSQPTHPRVGAVAGAAATRPRAVTHPAPLASSAVPAEDLDRVAAVAARTQPLVPQPKTAKPATAGPATSATAPKAAPVQTANAPAAGDTAAGPAGAGLAPLHVDRPRGPRVTVRTETAERAAAPAGPSESTWPWLGLALLLFGLTSIGLAFASVGAGGAAAVSAVGGRVRATNVTAAGLATRVRSKGLSTGTSGAPAGPAARRGIRYRD